MKKIDRKRLNNKGFTLIELLAVVVILAVVMGIAMTNVLSSMNKARGGSLSDSATSIAQAFNTKYTEALVDGVPDKVFGGHASEPLGATGGYSFQSSNTYYIDKKLADTFKISTKSYALADNHSQVTSNGTNGISNSFVKFDVSTAKFIVCMFADKNGNYYVDNYKTSGISQIGNTGVYAAAGEMYACSNGDKSWT